MPTPFRRFFLLLIYTVLSFTVLGEDTPMDMVYHPAEYPSFVLMVQDGNECQSYHVPDTIFNKIAGRTIFKVNRTELNPEDEFLRLLVNQVLPMANYDELRLVGIDIRGAASPEGPYLNNVRLAKGRTKALLDLMATVLSPEQMVNVTQEIVPEDYAVLLWMMEQDGHPDTERVRAIIERCGLDHPREIKRELMKVDDNLLWSRLFLQYFHLLRSSRVVLFFERMYAPRLETVPVLPTGKYMSSLRLDIPGPSGGGICHHIFCRDCDERRHVLAVSTNLLYDAFYMPNYGWAPMPNVQLEYFPRTGHYTFLAGFLSPYYHRWDRQQFFQIRDYHLEVRRYFNPGPRHLGSYVAGYVNANKYGIGLSATKGWEGEGFGGAVKVGYVLPLGRGRWRLDLHAAFGGYMTRHDPYVYGNPITGDIDGDYYYDYTGAKDDFHRRNHRFTWLGPTEIGVTLCFDLLYRKTTR